MTRRDGHLVPFIIGGVGGEPDEPRAAAVLRRVPKGHRPNLAQAQVTLDCLKKNGSTKAAFGRGFVSGPVRVAH